MTELPGAPSQFVRWRLASPSGHVGAKPFVENRTPLCAKGAFKFEAIWPPGRPTRVFFPESE